MPKGFRGTFSSSSIDSDYDCDWYASDWEGFDSEGSDWEGSDWEDDSCSDESDTSDPYPNMDNCDSDLDWDSTYDCEDEF